MRPDLAYGDVGSPPLVPPNCHLIYDITVDSAGSGALPGPPPMPTSSTIGSKSPSASFSAKKWDDVKKPSKSSAGGGKGKGVTLADKIAERAAKLAQQVDNHVLK